MSAGPSPKPEHRWPAAAAIIVALGVYLFLPAPTAFLPSWMVPAVGLVAFIPLVVLNPRRLGRETTWSRGLGVGIAVGLALINQVYIVQILDQLLNGRGVGVTVVYVAAGVWATNVIAFAVVFWELDRGGPYARRFEGVRDHAPMDFRFPQEDGSPGADPNWRPEFFDYLYFSLTSMMAFSPTDVMPLTHRAKALMAYESLTGFVLLALVIARAVNIIS
ncbi:DUF1345 domain-containing protein [Pseudolysinimonas yzui]|uniref:DUF1345 domain-containing protein n=1 Tax=Pseudolysinimonas yzui TaxID=2708254 RepID=A0A8J3GSJ0_9MICO|nr:DUF1345 domain-containing protein [Pseudolysinimonas yzui]GHF24917.1 hypothetical protein GCM10011600_27480 [Pseudolysinimonas yzui]